MDGNHRLSKIERVRPSVYAHQHAQRVSHRPDHLRSQRARLLGPQERRAIAAGAASKQEHPRLSSKTALQSRRGRFIFGGIRPVLANRRELLYGMATAFAGFAMPRLGASKKAQSGLRINAARLKRRLEDLSVYEIGRAHV